MPEPYIVPRIEFDGKSRKYSELFQNSQVPIPSPSDNRKRNVNHTSKLPPVMQQGKLGSCVSCAVSAVKEYQEYKETGREENVLLDGTRVSQVVKKSAHYLHDQRLRETNCVLHTSIEKTSTVENVIIGGADPVSAEVVEMCYKLQNDIEDARLIGVWPIGLGFKRDSCKHAKFGRINIGSENFNVVDDSEELFFSRVASADGIASSDDTNILALSAFEINVDEMNYCKKSGLRRPKSQYNFCHMFANRSNAILGEINKQYTTGQIVYFPDETNPRYRTELEILQSTTFLPDTMYIPNANKKRTFSYEIAAGGKVKVLSRRIKFEYAKVKLARIKGETPKIHGVLSKINIFARGWNITNALSRIGEVGIVDEIFWPYRNKDIWNKNVKTIPPEILHLGKNESLQVIGKYKDIEYHLHSLKIETVEEMIHAIEYEGPCVIATDCHHNMRYTSETCKGTFESSNILTFWKVDPLHDVDNSPPYPHIRCRLAGQHATTIVGFDYKFNSNGEIEGHFLIRNSWGDSTAVTAEGFVKKCNDCGKTYDDVILKCEDDNCDPTLLADSIFGHLPGHQIMSFDDWQHINYALFCKDSVNQFPYAPSDPATAKDYYYGILKQYCAENSVSIPEQIPGDQVFLLAIRGWRHDRPAPQFRNKYSDTIVAISSEFEITTFIASTQPCESTGSPTNKGWPRLANGVYHYNFNNIAYPEYLVPTTPIMIEYSKSMGPNTEYGYKEESNTLMNICGGQMHTLPPSVEYGTKHPIGSHIIPLDDSIEPPQSINELIGLLGAKHTKTENIALAEAFKLSMHTDTEKENLIASEIEDVDVPIDIIYALIDSYELIQYVENSQNGGGN